MAFLRLICAISISLSSIHFVTTINPGNNALDIQGKNGLQLVKNGLKKTGFTKNIQGQSSKIRAIQKINEKDKVSAANNGYSEEIALDSVSQLIPVDGGWTKFFFAGPGTETAFYIAVNDTAVLNNYYQISITDAYCPGDSFNLYKDGSYLLTTPRVPVILNQTCSGQNEDPNFTFIDPSYSSTKFMLPGPTFNMTIHVDQSPFGGGAAFIKVDRWLKTCQNGAFTLVVDPLVPNSEASMQCKKIGKSLAHIKPENVKEAVCTIEKCNGGEYIWVGQISLKTQSKPNDALGCIALDVTDKSDPSVIVVDCKTPLPVLCL